MCKNYQTGNGYILYLGYNNWHVEKVDDHTFTREFDNYTDALSFFNNKQQRGNYVHTNSHNFPVHFLQLVK